VVDGRDVSDAIRQPGAGDDASVVSQVAEVREALVELQRAMEPVGGVVMEGRDIGTVVFPDADLKVFLTASPRVRGTRRFEQLRARGEAVELAAVVAEVEARDRRDRGRPISPLRQAEDAVLLDTSELSIGQVVDALLSLARARQSMA
jgi:cytidylate kinase